MFARAKAICLAICIVSLPICVTAQNFPIYEDALPVASIDQDRLFTDSAFGRRFDVDYLTQRDTLAAENRLIEVELEKEELDLLTQRATLEPADFRVLATQFDEKVVRIRREQQSKINDLNLAIETARREFFEIAAPIIDLYMVQNGIIFILQEQSIFLGRQQGDITDQLIERIDARTNVDEPKE
jgi:Skp family chaperone for outer membrane proteins